MKLEIEIEDLGTYRMPNMWQMHRIRKMQEPNASLAWLAFGMGMTIQQFKKLPLEDREKVRNACNHLTAPSAPRDPEAPPRPYMPRKGEHLSDERKIELGRRLLQIKRQLPHGHFGLWVKERSGLSPGMVQECMRVAKAA